MDMREQRMGQPMGIARVATAQVARSPPMVGMAVAHSARVHVALVAPTDRWIAVWRRSV